MCACIGAICMFCFVCMRTSFSHYNANERAFDECVLDSTSFVKNETQIFSHKCHLVTTYNCTMDSQMAIEHSIEIHILPLKFDNLGGRIDEIIYR